MSIAEKKVEFKEIEEKVYREVCAQGCWILRELLEKLDEELRKNRDKKQYRNKGKRKTTLKTIMGEVEFRRSIYEEIDESGIKRYVYLLDEEIGVSGSGFFSGLMSEYIVKASCESSYRNAAESVSKMTGQRISHTAAWSVVQALGEKVDERESVQAKTATQHQCKGKLESKVLFEEQDGIWLKLQGESRKKYGSSKEMKLSIAYDGAERTGKSRYRLTNKVACANFEDAERFLRRKDGIIADTCCVDEIEMHFLNGDGAEWIRNGICNEEVYFQLDPYHRNKAIISYVHDPEKRRLLFKQLYSGEISKMMDCIEAYINSSDNERERNELKRLYTYFNSNREGLTEIHRRKMEFPSAPKDKTYRHLGCMESNVFSIIGNRMKGRRACWSIQGGNNMARMLCLKATDRLTSVLGQLTRLTLPEKYAESKSVPVTASCIPRKIGKGYDGYQKGGAFPATTEYKWLRDIGYGGFKA